MVNANILIPQIAPSNKEMIAKILYRSRYPMTAKEIAAEMLITWPSSFPADRSLKHTQIIVCNLLRSDYKCFKLVDGQKEGSNLWELAGGVRIAMDCNFMTWPKAKQYLRKNKNVGRPSEDRKVINALTRQLSNLEDKLIQLRKLAIEESQHVCWRCQRCSAFYNVVINFR